MSAQSKKLIAIVITTLLMPISVYFVYEISSIKENEKMMEEIYNDQLKSIIFSVNQYSNDFINALINKIEDDFDDQNNVLSEEVVLSAARDGISALMIVPLDTTSDPYILNNSNNPDLFDSIGNIVSSKNALQLVSYFNSGYRKIEPVAMISSGEQSYQQLMAILEKEEKLYLFIGYIEPLSFVEEVLSPKMQQLTAEKMTITLQKEGESEILFLTDSIKNDIIVFDKMWLFPQLIVGISPKTESISGLVSQRTQINLIAISLLFVLLITGIILIIRNINKEMQLAQAKSEFVSNVSHELRTPLSLISMFAETLLLGRVKSEGKKQEYTEIIFKETNRLTNIVNRILNFSKIDANKKTYHFEIIDMNELVAEVCRDYSYHLEQNGFDHHIHIHEDAIEINADREAIYEAVVNLIDNSIKYSQQNKSITISTSVTHGFAQIEVKDNGIGISENKLSHIFDKFYRASDQNLYVAQGAGLGLSIVKHIVDSHGGEIDVSSKENSGSSFRLRFKMV